MKRFMIMSICFLLIISHAEAACSQSGVPGNYSVDEEVTVTISCIAADKGDTGFYEWFNSTGDLLENDTFTIPSAAPYIVFESWLVTTVQSPQSDLYGNLTEEATFISQAFFNTSLSGGENDLDIINVEVTSEIFEGRSAGITGTIQNQGESVGYADVCIDVLDENGEPFSHVGCKKSEMDGEFFMSSTCDPDKGWCFGGVSYILDIDVSCPINSSSYVFCTQGDGDPLSWANGNALKPISVTDITDKVIINKWENETDLIPGVYLINEYFSKINITDDPTHITQEDIVWADFNNTNTSHTVNNTGQAYLTAGELAKFCFIINNTFNDEREISVYDLTFVDEETGDFFFPVEIVTEEHIQGSDHMILETEVKSETEETSTYEKCSEWFKIPYDITGSNTWDAQAFVLVEDYSQEFKIESDEFSIYGAEKGNDYVSIVDITNVTTSAYDTAVGACTDISVAITYDYFGNEEKTFLADFCFEQTTEDYVTQCYEEILNPDFGSSQMINTTFTLPYFETSGEAEVYVHIHEHIEDHVIGRLVGYGDIEPWNTFNITANTSSACKYTEDFDQELEYKEATALEDIANKTGTFHLSVDCPIGIIGENMTCTITAYIESGEVNKEVDFTCYIDSSISEVNWNQMINRTQTQISRDFQIPSTFNDESIHNLYCTADYYNLGSRRDSFSDSFKVKISLTGSASGTPFSVANYTEPIEVLKQIPEKMMMPITDLTTAIIIFFISLSTMTIGFTLFSGWRRKRKQLRLKS